MIKWTQREMLAVAAAETVADEDIAIIGLGLPQVAALLAKRTHAGGSTLMLEIGAFEPAPVESTMGIADPRMWHGCSSFGGMVDVLGVMLHGGRVTLGLLGALQVDTWGSINSTVIRTQSGELRRFNGSGGANDIASLAGRVVVVMQHSARKFADRLEFLTSPGRRLGGLARSEIGLPGGGTSTIVTDRAVISITDQGAVLTQIHPGEDVKTVLSDTPIPLLLPPDGVRHTEPPTSEQLEIIRSELDPHGWYTQ